MYILRFSKYDPPPAFAFLLNCPESEISWGYRNCMLDDVINLVKVFMMLLKPGKRERTKGIGSSVVGVPSGRPIPDDGEKGRGRTSFHP